MNRRNNPRGGQNRNQQVQQQYDQSFVSSNGNVTNQPQQEQPKVEPKVELPVQNNNDTMPVDDAGEDSEGGIGAKMRKIFANRKNLSPADRKRLEKERKARQLRRLRKLLTPKNAVVALYELQGPGMSEFTINTNGLETTAEIVVNNVRYEATAPNKHLAKARASEKALRDLVIAQMAKARQNSESKATAAANNGNGNAGNEDVEMAEVSESDDVPMLHLASYALYKLFNEWQNEGFDIPAIKPTKPPVKLTEAGVHPLAPKVAKTKADIPSDASTRHPTALLAFMRPQIPYEDLGSNDTNDPAKREFSAGVTVDGQRFIDDDDNDADEIAISDPQILKHIRSMLRPRTPQALLNTIHDDQRALENIAFDPNSPMHEQSGVITFNNVRYYALAQNRRQVKTRLAEQIFRDMILSEMRKIVTEVFPNVDNPMTPEIDAEVIFAHDDFPLSHVVSYALHKLQELWAIDGYPLPDYRPKARKLRKAGVTMPSCAPKRARGIEDLPDNASHMNPACLLAYMRPQARYEELEVGKDAPAPLFIYKLTVDDQVFTAEAQTKKMARRIAAAKACYTLFDIKSTELDDF